MPKNLVIVESPAKAKTIEGYLGKDFTVKSSFGHIRDLAEKDISIDVENDFSPKYVIPADKKKLVDELKKLAKDAETIWLATDEDREGEAISWHLMEALGLDKESTRRITFNEITEQAILKAIESPRAINTQLVDAQQARRVLDRLVGYELSPVLWKKVKPSLSAGRVQSVAVRLVVEREREIRDFEAKTYYRVIANCSVDGKKFKAELSKRFDTEQEADTFLDSCKSKKFNISSLETKPAKRSPAAPFTTSTLQQEASRKLGLSVNRTMSLAQALYEAGKISYMRTDSVNLSDTAMEQTKKEITKEFGPEYANPKRYKTKAKGAQEAHEAIRPTNIATRNAGLDGSAQKLYDLIWKRTVASQMADAMLEKTVVKMNAPGVEHVFQATGEVLKFEGFLKVYLESTDDEREEDDSSENATLPPMKEGQQVKMAEITATQRFSQHPPRYTEASLVKKLEELGIGRPSTYAPTISTVIKRQYVEKGERPPTKRKYTVLSLKADNMEKEVLQENTGAEKGKLFPTDIGTVVNDFLLDHFERIMDYNFTARVEKQFDEIAEGMLHWTEMIDSFYGPFHQNIEDTLTQSGRAKGERELGIDPVSGKKVIAKIGRYGPLIQIGEATDEDKPRFAALSKGQSIETITFQEAMKLFELPRVLGTKGEEEVSVGRGRFGPYVKLGKTYASLTSQDDPMTIDLRRALELITEKEEKGRNNTIKSFAERDDVIVLNGRYGPYLKIGKDNFKLPKDADPATLSLEQCLEIAAKSGPSKFKRKKR